MLYRVISESWQINTMSASGSLPENHKTGKIMAVM